MVQVYARTIFEENVSTPLRKLYRFYKTPTLAPGESITVNFTISTPELGYYTEGKEKVVGEGTVEIMVGMLNLTRAISPPPEETTPPAEKPAFPYVWAALGIALLAVFLLIIIGTKRVESGFT